MDLHRDQVPDDKVWAVVLESPPGVKDVSWFITSEGATQDYRECHDYVNAKGGSVERWLVKLPSPRMEADDVRLWVEGLLLWDDHPIGDRARRLDVYKK